MKNNGCSQNLDIKLAELRNVSWDFTGQKSRSAYSATHFYPARFISQLPSILISTLSKQGDLVLDPYCGSGTTLVEANRLSRRSVGLDINPISRIIAEARTFELQPEKVELIISRLISEFVRMRQGIDSITIPTTVQLEKWYSGEVADDLKRLYRIITDIEDEQAKTICMFCFSSILLKVCRETRHWGYVCDNTAPKGNPHRDVKTALLNVAAQLKDGYQGRLKFLRDSQYHTPKVYTEKAENLANLVQPESVDLVVTSPPYFGVVDYIKSQRLTMEWLGLTIEDFRKNETGARSKRHRKESLQQFKQELSTAFEGVTQALKPTKLCAVVFGSSKHRSFSEDDLVESVTMGGMVLVEKIDRNISSQRRLNPSLTSETLFIFQKPI